jgi:hypothetical protein
MNHDTHQNLYNRNNASLRLLVLAFFAPIYFYSEKLTVNTAMVSTYAGTYIKRNIIAALLTFTGGDLLYATGYTILGTLLTGMFVMFTGLCSVYLAAMFEKNRNHS